MSPQTLTGSAISIDTRSTLGQRVTDIAGSSLLTEAQSIGSFLPV
jgi:hypothetical protein